MNICICGPNYEILQREILIISMTLFGEYKKTMIDNINYLSTRKLKHSHVRGLGS